MPTTLPISIVFASLSPDFDGSPAELVDALTGLATLQTEETFALFRTGSTQPTSDVGPWAKNGNQWQYFDYVLGAYTDFLIPQTRLKYILQVDTGDNDDDPDPDVYLLWFVLSNTGALTDLRSYVGGSTNDWVSIFANYYTKAQVDALIEAAVVLSYPARGDTLGSQQVNADGVEVQLTNLVTEVLDPDDVYDAPASRYEVPVNGIYEVSAYFQVDDNGTLEDIEVYISAKVNGATVASGNTSADGPAGSRWYPKIPGTLFEANAGDIVTMHAQVPADGSGQSVLFSNGNWNIKLIQET